MKFGIFPILAAAAALTSCNDSGDLGPTGPVHEPTGIVSSDPAIKDNQVKLVLKPGYYYDDITPQDTVLVKCKVTVDRKPLLAYNLKKDCSMCWDFPRESDQHKMGLAVRACVHPGVEVTFQETATNVCALRRGFTVESAGGPSVPLIGSVVRFKTQWLGRLFSPGLHTNSSYEIRFMLNDLTEKRSKINMKLAANSISAKASKLAVKGVPVPVIVPGWTVDRAEDEPYAMPIPLTTGHKYEILLVLRLSCSTATTYALYPWASFSEVIESPNAGVSDPGFLRFYDIGIDAGTLP